MVRLLSTLVISAAISLSQVASAAAQVQGPTSAQSATPYQMSRMGGFGLSVRNLRGERVRIRLRGNGFTTREIALDHLHLKAAELAVERGYTFFQITEPEIEVNQIPTFVAKYVLQILESIVRIPDLTRLHGCILQIDSPS